jgi:peptidoglycan/LPS O-acetylase OafA/YrhL
MTTTLDRDDRPGRNRTGAGAPGVGGAPGAGTRAVRPHGDVADRTTGTGTRTDGPDTTGGGSGTRKRLDHIDAMRPIKQAGVVSTHSLLAFTPAAAGIAVGASIMLLHVTREAFLFVSACMLAYSYRGLGRGGLRVFYWRRFVSVGIPYLCWTVVYFLVTLHASAGWAASLGHLGYLVASGYYQLYYLLVIMQFYVVFPLLALALARWRNHHLAVLVVSGLLQIALVSAMHWGILPGQFQGFWATREITSYQFYLVAGMIAAYHLDDLHRWLRSHVALVIGWTVAAAALAEGWYYLAAVHHVSWMGSSADAFQPIVIPFNVGAIACIYLLGTALVDRRRSRRVRAMTRSGSDNSYGVYLAQMVFILALGGLGLSRLDGLVPWPVVCLGAVIVVFLACVLLTSILARTPLAKPLTGRSQVAWSTWLPGRVDPDDASTGGGPGPLSVDTSEPVVEGRPGQPSTPTPGGPSPLREAETELAPVGGAGPPVSGPRPP